MKIWIVIVFYFVIFSIGFYYREFLIAWINHSDPSAYLILMFPLSVFIATIPIIPFSLFGGLMGIKYGPMIGLLINWFGSFSAAIIYYALARSAFSNFFLSKIKSFKRLDQFTKMIKKNAFYAVLMGRLIPIIPPLVVNVYSAISKISIVKYLIASAIGTVPPMFLLSYSGYQIFSNLHALIIGVSVYGLFVGVVFLSCRLWLKFATFQ